MTIAAAAAASDSPDVNNTPRAHQLIAHSQSTCLQWPNLHSDVTAAAAANYNDSSQLKGTPNIS